MRKRLTGEESLQETIAAMAEGNPGAANVVSDLLKLDGGILNVFYLDDMNIRGSQIWAAYKNYCDFDIKKLSKCILARDENMIKRVNEICAEYGELAKVSVGG
jgi:hypothetical protein